MYSKFFWILFFTVGLKTTLFSQDALFVVEDVQPTWLVFEGDEYQPAKGDIRKTIYFNLDVGKYSGKYLFIESRQSWSIFINGKLKGSYQSSRNFSLDSLRSEFHTSRFFIAIHKERINKKNLLTKIVSSTNDTSGSTLGGIPKPETYFRDFVMVGTLTLLIFLIAMNQLTKLNMSYFSVKKLFSTYDSEDSQPYPRVASGSNMLFFMFSSLILAFYLIIIFHFTPEWFDITWSFSSSSFWTTLWQWVKLSLILLLAFTIKMILVFATSRLFGFKELFGFQIFSWVRVLMITFGFMNVFLVLYFLSHGSNSSVYIVFFWAVAVTLLVWSIILLTKVARIREYSMFHIFSYLCATEIIPLLISIKLLYH